MASIDNIFEFIDKEKALIVAEIGVRYGESTSSFLRNFPNIKKYYAIDPFLSYNDYEHDGFNNKLKVENNNIKKMFLEKFSNNKKVVLLNTFSSEAHVHIGEKELDVCFIDGNHEYSYVIEDLKNYFPKVKNNGIICGDDYFMRHYKNDIKKTLEKGEYSQNMVYEAVNDFFYDRKIQEIGLHRSYPKTWLVKK